MTQQECYAKAWQEVAKAFKDNDVSSQEVFDKIQECLVLYGDPNCKQPFGVINAKQVIIGNVVKDGN